MLFRSRWVARLAGADTTHTSIYIAVVVTYLYRETGEKEMNEDDVLKAVYRLIEDRNKAVAEKDRLHEVIAHYEAALKMTYPIGCSIELIDSEWRAARAISAIATAQGC